MEKAGRDWCIVRKEDFQALFEHFRAHTRSTILRVPDSAYAELTATASKTGNATSGCGKTGHVGVAGWTAGPIGPRYVKGPPQA